MNQDIPEATRELQEIESELAEIDGTDEIRRRISAVRDSLADSGPGDTYGVNTGPETIAELLDEGILTFDKEDGTRITLMYDTIPKSVSQG